MENSGATYNLPGTVSGVFFNKIDADGAYNALLQRGHTPDDISILMSDETLSKHENEREYVDVSDKNEVNPLLEKTIGGIVNAIISITSMISLPGLGISISNALMKKITLIEFENGNILERNAVNVVGSRIPEEHNHSYTDSMKEGGIIISVDPRNLEEKKAIVLDFKKNNGHDILGDDGYTELD